MALALLFPLDFAFFEAAGVATAGGAGAVVVVLVASAAAGEGSTFAGYARDECGLDPLSWTV